MRTVSSIRSSFFVPAAGCRSCAPSSCSPRAAATSGPQSGDVVSSAPSPRRASIDADAELVVYRMPATGGGLVDASTLVFVPHGAPPAGGWPVVGWIHGTTTIAPADLRAEPRSRQRRRRPDRRGAPLGVAGSGYAGLIGQLVAAGYAVVAPDLEGLGAVAKTPYPYYSLASEGRSLVAAIQAARNDDATLSNRWAAVGHSDGGHGVLADGDLCCRGARAVVPGRGRLRAVRIGRRPGQLVDTSAAADPANLGSYRTFQDLLVAMMTAGLTAQQPSFPSVT